MPSSSFFPPLPAELALPERARGVLRRLHPLLTPHFAAWAAVYCGTFAPAIPPLEEPLTRWFDQWLLGAPGSGEHEDIGQLHVDLALPQAQAVAALARLRWQILNVLGQAFAGRPRLWQESSRAVQQRLDIELMALLESYRRDLLAKNQANERLATVGQLAAGIGHELRNPLGVIESSQYLIRQQLERLGVADASLQLHLDRIAGEVKRSNKTIADLLDLARNRPPPLSTVAIEAVVAATLASFALPAGVRVDVTLAAGLQARGDENQIGSVLTNLLANAVDAMAGRGDITIEGYPAGEGIALRVRDGGPGVPADLRLRIFEPLFTTRGAGSGLGLALCRQIAVAHGGSLTLESSPAGQGASFLLILPAVVGGAP